MTGPQPLWEIVPPEARARYLRRTAQALLDEVDDLARVLAEEAGVPRTEALLAELLPSIGGLHELAEDGPGLLVEQRLGRTALLRAGRRSLLLQSPVGIVGIRGGAASPWAEMLLEAAAALLAGNGVVLAPAVEAVGARLQSSMARAGLPEGLVTVVATDTPADELAALCDVVVDTGAVGPKGTMLVLDGAPVPRAVSGALWAAFARSGQGLASVGMVVCTPSVAEGMITRLEAGARRLHVGDPRDPTTEVGPLAAPVEQVDALVRDAVDRGATLLCGGPISDDLYAPAVLRNVPPDAELLRTRVPGPVLPVVEARSEEEALELAAGSKSASIWAGERSYAERVARALQAELTWVNEHGVAETAPPVRLARHTVPHVLASQPTRLRSARWLPYDPALARASTAVAKLMHGRQSERLHTLREGAPALARVAVRLAREARER